MDQMTLKEFSDALYRHHPGSPVEIYDIEFDRQLHVDSVVSTGDGAVRVNVSVAKD